MHGRIASIWGFTALLTAAVLSAGDDWPQWRGPGRDGAWNETGVPETFPATGFSPRWTVPVGWGYSSPIVAGGLVFVTDAELVGLVAREQVHCFAETTGKRIWEHAYAVDYAGPHFIDENNKSGPVATPIVSDGRVYSLGRCGDLFCFEAGTGRVIWHAPLHERYPAKPLMCYASPLVEGDLLIVFVGATPDACVIAFDKASGKQVWSALDETATNSSPIVVTAAGKRQLIVWTEQSITSLEPTTGKTFWRQRLVTNSDYVVSTPVVQHELLLIGGLMMKLDAGKPAASVLWPKSRAVVGRVLSHTSTPLIDGNEVYSAKSSGEFVCLDAKTGEQIWETDKVTDLNGGASIHLTRNGDSFLLYNDRGELIRARLSREGYKELGRVALIEPTFPFGGRKRAWAPPAYANRHVFARSDKELVCASLEAKQ